MLFNTVRKIQRQWKFQSSGFASEILSEAEAGDFIALGVYTQIKKKKLKSP